MGRKVRKDERGRNIRKGGGREWQEGQKEKEMREGREAQSWQEG